MEVIQEILDALQYMARVVFQRETEIAELRAEVLGFKEAPENRCKAPEGSECLLHGETPVCSWVEEDEINP